MAGGTDARPEAERNVTVPGGGVVWRAVPGWLCQFGTVIGARDPCVQVYVEGVTAYQSGKKDSAVPALQQVIRDNPN